MGAFALLTIACLSTVLIPVQSVNKIACYYGTWARYSGLKPEQIDASICTSLLVSFVQVSDDLRNIIPFDIGDVDQVYPVFRNMRQSVNNDLKIVIALGGATHDNSRFNRMIAEPAILAQFSVNLVLQLRQWGMDGVDVDWEFPDNPQIHLTFIRALRKAIDEEILQPGQSRLELSGAMPAGSHYIVKYNIPECGKIFDVVYIMAYDYHGPWDSTTGHNSPLFPRQDDSNQLFNTEWTVSHWYTEGIPKSKLYVGVPTYGRTFILRNPSQNGVNVPANGGQLKTYGQSCSQILSKPNALQFWDAASEVPYAVEGSTWLSYASVASISNKCQWMDLNEFGGAMVWSLHQDDFAGVCGQGTFPLVRALKACAEDFPTPPTPPTLPTTTTPQPLNTPPPSGFCVGKDDNSFHAVLNDCTKFIQCYAMVSYQQNCPVGLHFSESTKVCDYPSMAGRTDCNGMPLTEAPGTEPPAITTTSTATTGATTSPTSSVSTTVGSTTARPTPGPIIATGQTLPKLACYYGTWSRYSGLKPNQIDANLCTSILISFVQVRDDLIDIRPFDTEDISQVYPVLRNLRAMSESGLKLVIALGGAVHDNSRFDRMIADKIKLRTFASNTVKTLRSWGMDGIDIDWEFPKRPLEHVAFLGAMRAAIEAENLPGGREKIELSAALSAGSYIPNYDIPLIGSLLDIGYVMTYDYHGSWEDVTGHNSPLFPRQDDPNQNLNTEWTLNHWYTKGFPKNKLYIGLPTYARQFTLTNPTITGVGAPFLGGGQKTYRDVCSVVLKSDTVTDVWDSESKVPYAYDGTTWTSYANVSSIATKCNWAVQQGYAGGMVWSLGQDDYDGICQQGTFPLIRALKACSDTFPTPPPLPTTPTPVTVAPGNFCSNKRDGYYEVSGACESFIQCNAGRAYTQSCTKGLHFTNGCTCCNYPSLAGRTDCGSGGITQVEPVTTSQAPIVITETASTSTFATSKTSTAVPTETTTAVPTEASTTTPTEATSSSTTSPEGSRFSGRVDNIACYYGTWARYSGLKPENIDAELCSSILVSFVQVRPDLLNIVPFEPSDINDVFPPIIAKKRQYGLKVIIALGGASHANERFDSMIANPATLASFARNTVQQIRQWDMDGIDIDWEFPKDAAEHVIFMTAMRNAIDNEVRGGGVDKLVLSAALPAGHYIKNYDIPAMGRLLDIGYVMAYDYHGPWESFTGHNSPLFPRRDDTDQNLNTEWTVLHWINNGLPREKVYLGVPTYARTFRVANPELTGTGVGVRAFGIQTLTYRQVCNNVLSKPNTKTYWDGESMVPYAVDGDIWVSYANGTSLANKCYWADLNGLGGLMVWSLHQDDYDGLCAGNTLSLVRALKSCSGTLPPTTPLSSTISTITTTTTTAATTTRIVGPVTQTFCKTRPSGFYAIPGDCSNFVRCVNSVTHFFSCQTGLRFDLKCECCQFPDEAGRDDCDGSVDPVILVGNVPISPTVTHKPDISFCVGRNNGNFAIPGVCSLFYTCSNGFTFKGSCEYPTLFNEDCDCCSDRISTLTLRSDCVI